LTWWLKLISRILWSGLVLKCIKHAKHIKTWSFRSLEPSGTIPGHAIHSRSTNTATPCPPLWRRIPTHGVQWRRTWWIPARTGTCNAYMAGFCVESGDVWSMWKSWFFDIFCDVSKIRQTVWIHPIHPSINASEYAVCRRIAGHLLDGLGPESTHGWIAPHNSTLSLKTRTTSLWWRQHLHLASPAHWDMDCMDWCLSSFSLWLKWLKCIPANQWNPVIPIDHAAGSLDINGQDWSWQDLQRHRYRGLLWLARPGTETNWEMPLLSYWCYCTCRAQVVYLSMSEDGAGHPSSVPMCFGVKSMRLWWIQESEIPWCIADRSFLRPISSISCMSIVWVCFQWIQFLWISPGLSTSNGVCRWSHIQIGIWPWFIAPMCGWAGRPRPEVNYVEKGLSSGNVLGLLTMAVACRK